MTLHGDLPPTKSQDSDAAAEPRSSPIGAAAATNEFVPSPRSPYAHKKSSDGVSPKHSSFGSNPDRVRTVIEVLNNPRIDSPLSRSASRTAVESQRSAEVRSDDRAKGSVSPSAAAPKTAGPLGDIAQPAKETMPPATHMQSDASTDASIEARTTELGEGSDPKETIEPRQASATPMADGGDAVMAEAAG